MKNNSFNDVIKAPVEDRRDLFLATATRIGVPLQNIEKDFWVSAIPHPRIKNF